MGMMREVDGRGFQKWVNRDFRSGWTGVSEVETGGPEANLGGVGDSVGTDVGSNSVQHSSMELGPHVKSLGVRTYRDSIV